MTLSLQLTDLTDPATLLVTLNGQPLAAGTLADGWVSYAAQPEAVKVGANEVSVTLTGDAGPVWADLTVKVTYPKG